MFFWKDNFPPEMAPADATSNEFNVGWLHFPAWVKSVPLKFHYIKNDILFIAGKSSLSATDVWENSEKLSTYHFKQLA